MNIINNRSFIIDSENYKNFDSNYFYGYKKDDNFGFWWSIMKKNNAIIFNSSDIPPCLCYYKNDRYWAISNSVYYLEKHLNDKNIKLTLNNQWLIWESKADNRNKGGIFGGYTRKDWTYNITKFNEINLFDTLAEPYINIDTGELHINVKSNIYFNLSWKENINLIDNWLGDWKNYTLKNQPSFWLSGGIDCMTLYFLFCDNKLKCKAEIFENINNIKNDYLANGIYDNPHALSICRNLNIPYTLYKNITENWWDFEADKTLYDEFFYGLSITIRGLNNKLPSNTEVISGSCAAVFKEERFLCDINYFTLARRFIVTAFIAKYYTYNLKTLVPYFDKRLLKLHFNEPMILHIILILKYKKELLDFKFVHKNEIYSVNNKWSSIVKLISTELNEIDKL